MSRLSDLVNDAILTNTRRDGTIDANAAVADIRPNLDDDDRDILVSEALVARVTNAAKTSKAAILGHAKKRNLELPFEGLHGAYPLDLDGRYIKRTEALTRAEFERVISIREKQIIDDMAHLKRLREAFAVLEPIWAANPDWTVAECVAWATKASAA